MSNSHDAEPSPLSGGRSAGPDTQALIGLLENLVPLLLQFQTQSLTRTGVIGIGEGYGAPLEQQAAAAFSEDVVLDAVRNLSAYVQKNVGRYPALETYNGVVTDAKRALAARDYQRALALVFEAYRAITILRAVRPELPPIRQRGSDELAAGQAELVH